MPKDFQQQLFPAKVFDINTALPKNAILRYAVKRWEDSSNDRIATASYYRDPGFGKKMKGTLVIEALNEPGEADITIETFNGVTGVVKVKVVAE